MDARIPNASTAWQLWYIDTFDRESTPSLQASGEGILQGLYELWRYTLHEGILENGSASFSRFHLTWGNTASTRVDVDVKPFDNQSLLKLRQWADLRAPKQKNSVLSKMAHLHSELLQKSDRWSAEARELLARVESMMDPEEL